MEIHQSTTQGVTIITLIGRMDTKSTMAFEEDRRTWKTGPIILDLGSLEYICSSGLRAFLQLKRDCANQNTPVIFAGYRGSVEKVIRVSGFENIFPRYSTVEEALAVVAAGST
ncbi:MAG: STAS domain-containing protein [Methanoregula sp.]|nr:STAS domain-containing protein [Methanoregula sp.]